MSLLPGNLSIPYILSYLTTHDWDDCVDFFGNHETHKTFEPDQNGFITLDAKAKKFSIIIGKTSNISQWTFELPGTKFSDLTNAPGKLYTAKDAKLPTGDNQFWIQQYRGQLGIDVGRTVIEFYTDKILTAVFKTNVDNYGASGNGEWSGTP